RALTGRHGSGLPGHRCPPGPGGGAQGPDHGTEERSGDGRASAPGGEGGRRPDPARGSHGPARHRPVGAAEGHRGGRDPLRGGPAQRAADDPGRGINQFFGVPSIYQFMAQADDADAAHGRVLSFWIWIGRHARPIVVNGRVVAAVA
ncbi:hypothetical protein B4Q13_21210, partial [Lacticaseibacillus rhamnosus]